MKVVANGSNGNQGQFEIDGLPDTCPICHFSIQTKPLHEGSWTGSPDRVQIILKCPRVKCQELFIATYRRELRATILALRHVAPRERRPLAVPNHVSQLSPKFVKVFNQAADAEASGLDEISGMGYRKALEYLIKDFAISQNPTAEDEIKAQLLGQCIAKHISDPSVQNTAKRAVWLGNDETHYVRRWESKDINDLKLLIKLAVNAIENVLLIDHYEKEMPEGKK